MDELNSIEQMGSDVGLDFNVSLFCVAVSLSFLISLLSTKIESRKVFDTFIIFTVVGGALGIIFFIKWFKGKGAFSRLVQKIRDRQIGPTGNEGEELPASELALLPLEPAPALTTAQSILGEQATQHQAVEGEAK